MTVLKWIAEKWEDFNSDAMKIRKKPEIRVTARVWREDKQMWENI
jgi:hypothetical protein